MAEIPKAPIARIMKDTGVERVSEDAKVELAEALEEIARNISIKANEAAKLAKRKTIKAEDIKFAVNELDL
ncbi:histone family protein [Methanobrevibacter sp.]|uniref:histone family protein n=1 Tax=Methanobrevibacter sp. TaxID=66852 RepID=UPI00388FA79B